ncbi:MAG: hypothetical protein EOP60_16470 [Sphingomonadales bacterium]|nr:MAG: hypothetical protein EOP60_16470 [Sphingomonadales bacterium]
MLGASDPVGRTLHFERTNRDGSEPEQIYFHRAAPDRMEVYKMVRRCTRAALVSAVIDPKTGAASSLEAAQLRPDAQRAPYATLADEARGIVVRLEVDGAPREFVTPIATRPWHLYDYDLATLSAAFEVRKGSRKPMRFGMAVVWPKEDRFVEWMGDASAKFIRAETHLGRKTLRFEVSGTAFGAASGGPLWVEAKNGHLVDVQWGRPNHDNYIDFRLRLIGEEPAGDAEWTALLRRHFAGCPAK